MYSREYVCDVTQCISTLVGSIPTVPRHTFQACPVWIYTQSNITNIISVNCNQESTKCIFMAVCWLWCAWLLTQHPRKETLLDPPLFTTQVKKIYNSFLPHINIYLKQNLLTPLLAIYTCRFRGVTKAIIHDIAVHSPTRL